MRVQIAAVTLLWFWAAFRLGSALHSEDGAVSSEIEDSGNSSLSLPSPEFSAESNACRRFLSPVQTKLAPNA